MTDQTASDSAPGEGISPTESATNSDSALKLSPQLIDEVVKKVYQLWMTDLRMEQERKGARGSEVQRNRFTDTYKWVR